MNNKKNCFPGQWHSHYQINLIIQKDKFTSLKYINEKPLMLFSVYCTLSKGRHKKGAKIGANIAPLKNKHNQGMQVGQ